MHKITIYRITMSVKTIFLFQQLQLKQKNPKIQVARYFTVYFSGVHKGLCCGMIGNFMLIHEGL